MRELAPAWGKEATITGKNKCAVAALRSTGTGPGHILDGRSKHDKYKTWPCLSSPCLLFCLPRVQTDVLSWRARYLLLLNAPHNTCTSQQSQSLQPPHDPLLLFLAEPPCHGGGRFQLQGPFFRFSPAETDTETEIDTPLCRWPAGDGGRCQQKARTRAHPPTHSHTHTPL